MEKMDVQKRKFPVMMEHVQIHIKNIQYYHHVQCPNGGCNKNITNCENENEIICNKNLKKCIDGICRSDCNKIKYN